MIKRWGILLAKLAMTLGPLWYLFSTVDLSRTWEATRGISSPMFAASFALLVVQVMLCSARWQYVLRIIGYSLSFSKALEIFWIGNFFGLVLPGTVGGDAIRMWKTKRAGIPIAASVNSVLLERGATLFGLVLLVAATQPLLAKHLQNVSGLWIFPALSAAGAGAIILLCLLDRLPRSLDQWRLIRGFAQLARDTRQVFLYPVNALSLMAVVFVGHVNLVLGVYVLALGLGAPATLLDCLVLVPPVILVTTLPISIAGWGARELAMVTLFGFVGVSSAQALAMSVLFGVVTTVTALPGGLFWLLSNDRRQRQAEREASAEKTVPQA